MRRIATLAALVLLLMAGRPLSAQSPTVDERLDLLESKMFQIESIIGNLQMEPDLPHPFTVSEELTLYPGGVLSWSGDLPTNKTFFLWCRPFQPGLMDNGTVGLECGWTLRY